MIKQTLWKPHDPLAFKVIKMNYVVFPKHIFWLQLIIQISNKNNII